MRPVTAQFLAALTGSHKMIVRANIASHASPTVLGAALPVMSGRVSLDANAAVRGSLSMVIQGTWPTQDDIDADGRVDGSATIAHPYGIQIHVSRGIEFGNSSIELARLGVFVVTSIQQTGNRSSPQITITGQDRSSLVASAKTFEPEMFYAGTSWASMTESVLTGAHSLLTVEYDFDAVTTTLNADLLLEEKADRWAFLIEAYKALGKTLWFDHEGVCQVASIPDPGVPVWTVAAGRGGVMVDSSRTMTREGQFNGILAVGEAASDVLPVRALARDLGGSSVTAWGDAFGRRLGTIQSALWASDLEAAAAAETELRRTVGLPLSLDLSAVPNPALEPWDVLSVEYPGGDVELHVVDRVDIPLGASEAVTLATRDTSTVVVEV